MKNPSLVKRNILTGQILFFIFFSFTIVSGINSINLDSISSEIKVDDSNDLDGFNKATWNVWINQQSYVPNSGIIGKYIARTGQRSYLIRTSNTNGVSVIISQDGTNVESYSSTISRKCGIRANDEWTMITVTYDGSLIKYYRNGILCDQDQTTLSSIHNSPSPVRFGGGNNIFLLGKIDELIMYNESLAKEQILRIYDESFYGANLGQSIPVLVYHKIEDGPAETIKVSPAEFKKQMDYLKKNNFQTITLNDYNDWKKGLFLMPKKAIIIVFDDGFKSVYTNAKPIMDQNGFIGSIPTVARYASFTSNASGYLNWNQIKDLSNNGWSIESHSATHSHMLRLNESEFRDELLSSKQIITSMTGKVPASFTFPFHESNELYTNICGEYYDLCWTQGSLNPSYDFKSTPGKTYLSLRRINVVDLTAFKEFSDFLRRDTNKAGEWNMEEGLGSTTVDTSGNNNIGMLLNGASWSSESYILNTLISPDSLKKSSIKVEDTIDTSKNKFQKKNHVKKIWPDNMPIEEDKFYPPVPLRK
ncbi:MAG: polysaccharide deacetylase family protein [Nanoarchaeota archaeon]|nr:polysaccharide deacetylase family protein [Nanoarchaeota archaeon]